jgi:hypothetical protein
VCAVPPLPSYAAARVGHAAVRTRGTLGTLGGSLANADPAADCPASACCRPPGRGWARPGGSRTVDVDALLRLGAIGEREVVVAIELPRQTDRDGSGGWDGWGFHEASRPGAYALPLVTVAAVVRLAADGTVTRLRRHDRRRPRPVRQDESESVTLGPMYVPDHAQGHDLGGRMMTEFLTRAGPVRIRLGVADHNERAIRSTSATALRSQASVTSGEEGCQPCL